MTVWSLHFLNARHQLTPIMSEARAAAHEAVALGSAHVDLPRFDLVLRAGSEVVPEWGIGGEAPAPGVIEITVNTARLFDPALLIRSIVHQMHHLIRWAGPGYGKSLGEGLVSEGLAGHFVLQVLGGKPDPWDATAPSAGAARRAMSEWSRLGYDHGEWFLGKGKIRKWSGHGLGHRLIAEHLAQNPEEDAITLASRRADAFREAMRRLAKADGEPADEEQPAEDTATPAPEATEDSAAHG